MNLLNAFELIVISSLIGSVIVLIILIIKGIFRTKLNSTFNYYIWLLLLIKLIIPFGPQNPLNVYNIYENFQVQNTTNENIQLSVPTLISLSNPSNKSEISNPINIALKYKLNIETVFSFIWILGIVILIGVIVAGHRKLKNIVIASIKDINGSHKEILYKCVKAMNITTKVELLCSSEISSPSLCGIIKPTILIPVTVAGNVCYEEFKYIILHELTHLKNKDIYINWVITLLSVVYWFNPILLYGFHKMKQDCEFSCDSQTISYLDEGKNIQYGNAIIRVLELAGSGNRLIGTTTIVMNSSEIKRRIVMISKYKKINIKSVLLGIIIFVIIGGLGISINTSKLQSEKPVNIAKEYAGNLYTVDAERIALYKKMVGSDGAASLLQNIHSLDKNIQPLMTKDGYAAFMANRLSSVLPELCANGNYTLKMTNITFDKNLYGEKEEKAGYYYEVKLKFASTDGKADRTDSARGYIGVLKESGKWKVFTYKESVPTNLSKELMLKKIKQ